MSKSRAAWLKRFKPAASDPFENTALNILKGVACLEQNLNVCQKPAEMFCENVQNLLSETVPAIMYAGKQ